MVRPKHESLPDELAKRLLDPTHGCRWLDAPYRRQAQLPRTPTGRSSARPRSWIPGPPARVRGKPDRALRRRGEGTEGARLDDRILVQASSDSYMPGGHFLPRTSQNLPSETVRKVPEAPETRAHKAPKPARWARFGPDRRPNTRPECHSHPLSDCFSTHFAEQGPLVGGGLSNYQPLLRSVRSTAGSTGLTWARCAPT
jgi:hypothetical protein